jgi:hypothetical protein
MIDDILRLFTVMYPMWIRAFAFTLLIEAPVYILLGRKLSEKKCSYLQAGLAGAAGSCVTHPLLWFVWPLVIRNYTLFVISGELIVAAVESLMFFLIARKIRLSRAAIVAVSANAVSFGAGMLFHRWILGV